MWRIVMLALIAAAPAHARECAAINFPDRMQLEGSELQLNGLGMRKATILKVSVYVAALYVGQPSRDPAVLLASAGPSRLTLHFVRNVGVDDLRNAWTEGFQKNAKNNLPALRERIARLNSWMSDVKTGQRLTFTHRPGAGVEVDVNGAVKGVIEGNDFAQALLSIWLGSAPPNPELKQGLLGGECGK